MCLAVTVHLTVRKDWSLMTNVSSGTLDSTHSLTLTRLASRYQSIQNVTWRNCRTNQITLRRFGNYNLFSIRVCSVCGLVQFFNSITTFKLIATYRRILLRANIRPIFSETLKL